MTLFDKKAVADNMVKNHGYSREYAERQAKMLSRLINERLAESQSKDGAKSSVAANDRKPEKKKPLIGDKILNRIKKRMGNK